MKVRTWILLFVVIGGFTMVAMWMDEVYEPKIEAAKRQLQELMAKQVPFVQSVDDDIHPEAKQRAMKAQSEVDEARKKEGDLEVWGGLCRMMSYFGIILLPCFMVFLLFCPHEPAPSV